MRRIVAVAAILVAAVVVATILLVASLNRLLEANRDRIVAGTADGFARPVTIGRIAAGFHGGVAVELHDLTIGEDPAFGEEPFVTASEVHAVVGIVPLLRGRIEVQRVAAVSPQLTIIRTAGGMNVDSLGRRPRTGVNTAAVKDEAGATSAASGGISAIAAALVNLENATVRFLDRSGRNPRETTIAPLDLDLTDVGLRVPVGFDLRATVQGEPPTTVRVRGMVGPLGDPPFAADVPLEQHVTVAGGNVDVPDLVIAGRIRRDDTGRPVANVRVTAATAQLAGIRVSDLEIAGAERDGTATLDTLRLTVFGGTVTGTGRVAHATAPVTVAFETALRGVDVAAVVASRTPGAAAHLEGRLDADCSVTATADDEASVRRSLAGRGHVVIHEGALTGVNVADGVFSRTGIGGLGVLVPPRIRNRYRDVFAGDDTRFERLTADVRIGGERITVDSVDVSARDYSVSGTGSVTFARYVDFTATLVASERLTEDIFGSLKEARFLADASGRLGIPFRLTGTLPNAHVRPDEQFVTRALRKVLVGEGLDSFLGGDERDGGKGEKKGAGKLLQKGLDRLFGR